jgi:hypothetical protein
VDCSHKLAYVRVSKSVPGAVVASRGGLDLDVVAGGGDGLDDAMECLGGRA